MRPRVLTRTRRRTVTVLALTALLIAQLAAGLHVLKHFGTRGETAGLPGQHMQLCLECASFAPISGAHGGGTTALAVAYVAAEAALPLLEVAAIANHFDGLFQARAPPRGSITR
jgi:hypothetical protein